MTDPQPQRPAWLVLTDISGYTAFVKANAAALHHAQYVISELMNAILQAAGEPLTLAKLEGDAVFFQAADADGQLGDGVGRSLQRIFEAFYARRDAMIAANTCPCPACTDIVQLTLKAVAHRGEVVSYQLGGFQEVAGLDVILVHRLLKNTVPDSHYLLATQAAWPGLGLPPEGARVHRERYEDVGAVDCMLLTDSLPAGSFHAHSHDHQHQQDHGHRKAPAPTAGWLDRKVESWRKHLIGARFKLRNRLRTQRLPA